MKIVILPQVSNNKGDRAILHFMLQEMVDHGVCDITVATSNPADWETYSELYGNKVHFIHLAWMIHSTRESKIPFRSVKWYLSRVVSKLRARVYGSVGYALLRTAVVNKRFEVLAKWMCHLCNPKLWTAIQEADAVVTTGGHRITTLLQPDVVGHQMFDMASVVLADKKLIFWSQTIGAFDFKKEINRQLVERVINHAGRIYVRDEASINQVNGFLDDGAKLSQTYDSVFGLKEVSREQSLVPPSKRDKTVGISVYTGCSGREIDYQPYIYSLAEMIKHAVAEGYRIKFFPMHLNDLHERTYFDDIIDLSGHWDCCESVSDQINTVEHLRELAKCQIFVGHKTHSIIFALTTATPLITIAYHVKSLDFMNHFGLEEYGFPESETTPEKLIGLFEKVRSNLDEIYAVECEKSKLMNEKVKNDFAGLIEELEGQG